LGDALQANKRLREVPVNNPAHAHQVHDKNMEAFTSARALIKDVQGLYLSGVYFSLKAEDTELSQSIAKTVHGSMTQHSKRNI
jgi:hypothetical protein